MSAVNGVLPRLPILEVERMRNANLDLTFRCAETGREQVWVVEPVKAGQEITISYIRQGAADGEAKDGHQKQPRTGIYSRSPRPENVVVFHVLEIACHFGSGNKSFCQFFHSCAAFSFGICGSH